MALMPTQPSKCCIDFTEVVEALSDFYTLDELDDWLNAPNSFLNDRAPIALICEGRKDEVLRLCRQLRDGAYL